MKQRRPEEAIVEFLSHSPHARGHGSLPDLSERRWNRVLQWLDDSGLALYFLQKLKDRNAIESVPSWVALQLTTTFTLNQRRSEALLVRFNAINTQFGQAGIPFTVLKGFSLIPNFCPSSALRHQSDFDYLVNGNSLDAAREILLALGYTPKPSTSSLESIYLSPNAATPSRSGRQYSPDAPHAVELHLDVWDAQLYRLPSLPQLFSPEETRTFHQNGVSFPALSDEDAFLLQVIHACHHLFTQWVRISCLFEIGYFLARRSSDFLLWSRLEQRVGTHVVLRELVVIATEMAAKIFACPVPSLVSRWAGDLRPGARLWLDKYARTWVFSDFPVYELSLFPTSQLVRFLYQQYSPDGAFDDSTTQATPRSSRPFRMLSAIKRNPALLLNGQWWRQQRLLRRTLFHGLATFRYACEIPRWRWLMRTAAKSSQGQAARINAIAQCPASKS